MTADNLEPSASLPEGETASPILDQKTWHEVAKSKFDIAKKNKTDLSVLFIDLDRFKDVNDTLGHEVGDEVIEEIKELVRILESQFRTGTERPEEQKDVVTHSSMPAPTGQDLISSGVDAEIAEIIGGRVGGDEFAVVCATGLAGTQLIITRLREIFDKFIHDPKNKRIEEVGLGISIGAASITDEMNDYSELVRAADKAMYEDKRAQLTPLNEQQIRFLDEVIRGAEEHKIRLRDIGRLLMNLSERA